MIDQLTVDRIIDAADIVEVVSDFVSLRKRGVNYVGLCPFHDEKTPSFSVSPSKGICKCFSCGKGGTAIHFVMEHEQLSYYEALRYLAKKYNIEIVERELSQKEKENKTIRESMLIVNEFAQNFFTQNLFETDEGRAIGLQYFYERGFREDIIKRFKLGYSPSKRDALVSAAMLKGYKPEYLIKTGLCIEPHEGRTQLLDRFRERVIFPVNSLSGKVIAFGGRILKSSEKSAKYVNSPESEVYHKSNTLYGLYQAKGAIVKGNNCFLVEGYTDVLSMHQAGIENVVASSGTALTPGQIRQIHRFSENITVLYDGDSAGIKASLRGIDLLLEEGMNVKVVLLPDGEDPDSFAKSRSAEEFKQYIAAHEVDFITFKTNLLIKDTGNNPILRSQLINDIVKSITSIPNDITKSVYIKECSRLLDVREEVLLQAVAKSKVSFGGTPVASYSQPKLQQDSVSAKPQNTSTVASGEQNYLYDIYENRLVKLIIKYGLTPIVRTDEGVIDVLTFILNDLNNDSIDIESPIYKKIITYANNQHEVSLQSYQGELFTLDEVECSDKEKAVEYWCNYVKELNEGFTKQFLNHPDDEISATSVNMISEKYQLSKKQRIKSEEERLYHLTRRTLVELKDAIITEQIKLLNQQLKHPDVKGNPNLLMDIIREINDCKSIKSQLAKDLGERILNPQ